MFSSLPLGTTVEFTAEKACLSKDTLSNVDATKTTAAYIQNGSKGESANACLVPKTGLITITIPENEAEQEVEVKVEKEEEPFTIIDSLSVNLYNLLKDNSGNYKLEISGGAITMSEKIPNFTGSLISENDLKILINPIADLDCIFTGNKPKNIENINFYYLAEIENPIQLNCPN